jgi:hypothetical protein
MEQTRERQRVNLRANKLTRQTLPQEMLWAYVAHCVLSVTGKFSLAVEGGKDQEMLGIFGNCCWSCWRRT